MNVLAMELDSTREPCGINDLRESSSKQPNVELVVAVKQEAPDADEIKLELVQEEVVTIKSEKGVALNQCKSTSSKTLVEPKVISNHSLELKSGSLAQGCHVETLNISIKQELQELLHEELVIKSEDDTIQATHFDDKYNLGNQLHKDARFTTSRGKPFKCHICHYTFSRKGGLKIHLRIHTGEKPFKCEMCDYSSTRIGDLNTHLRTHTGEKPFKCKMCHYSGARKADLTRHFRTHTEEKSFKCHICEYSCAQKPYLMNHLKRHTGEKRFKCNMCDYRFARNQQLKAHLITHSVEKSFKCNICNLSCAQRSHLKSHLRSHTREKLLNAICVTTVMGEANT